MVRPREFDRDAALRKAMRLFWSKGYEGTSMADLIETMGISRSSLYETFGDKQDLFLEALQRYQAANDRNKADWVAKAATVREGLRNFFNASIDFVLSDESPGGCFFTNTATALETLDEPIRAAIRSGLAKQEEFFYSLLERGINSGEIDPNRDIRAMARYLMGLTRGITVIARIVDDRKMLEDIVEVGLKVLD